jgi:hypothetical protein
LGWPTSQKLSLEERFFFKSSVRRSVFIWTFTSVTWGHLVSSMSFAASGSKWKEQNRTRLGRETGRSASTRSRGEKSLAAVLAARMGSRKRERWAWAVATMPEVVRGSRSRRLRAVGDQGWVIERLPVFGLRQPRAVAGSWGR